MNKIESAKRRNLRRKFSIKKKVKAQKGKLRLCISRSNKNFYAQVIDDAAGTTLVGLSTMSGEFKDDSNRSNSDSAVKLGKLFAEKAIEKGIKQVVFDRNGYLYHGTIKAFADSARENGLEF